MERNRNRFLIAACSLFLVLFLFSGSIGCVYGAEKAEKANPEEVSLKKEPLDLSLSLSENLYRGDKVKLAIGNLKNAKKRSAESSNPKVAVIDKSGMIRAKKCGFATLTLKLTYVTVIKTIQIKVKVTKSSYRKKTGFSFYPGETSSVSASSSVKGAAVSLESENPSVIQVSGKKLRAGKTGKCRLIASVRSETRCSKIAVLLCVVNKAQLKVTNAMKDRWFKGSIMAGHSVGIGFQMYCDSQYDGFLGNALHLSTTSYGVYNDRAPVTGSSLHPVVNGRKARLKDHVKALGTKKVFINYGMNDIGMYGPNQFVEDYKALVNELLRENKKTTVYIVATTPLFSGKGMLTNENVRIANRGMKEYAKKNRRVEFIDVFTPLLDSTGKLRESFCSDAYCHMTFDGYAVYANTLKDFAAKKIIEETDRKDALFTKKETAKTRRSVK